MHKIITVHGTFAHQVESGTEPDVPWWKPGSAFASDIAALVEGAMPDGQRTPVEYEPFVWSGDNSETGRRVAGAGLLSRMRELDRAGDSYCVVAHSHGGSVVSHALLLAATQRKPLTGLLGWITVGTPFVELKKMSPLFARLSLINKVILVASLMLLLMFMCYFIGQLIGGANIAEQLVNVRTLLAALMMSFPAIAVISLLSWLDRRDLTFYRYSTIERARREYGAKWTSLWHAGDEAVVGLRSLKTAKVQVFAPNFATQRITLFAVFALPLVYLLAVTSPTAMVGLTHYLRDHYYHVGQYLPRATAYAAERQEVRNLATQLVKAEQANEHPAPGATAGPKPDWGKVRAKRMELTAKFPDHGKLAAAIRFKQYFLEDDSGKPCPGNTLCGGGRSFTYNTKLIYHLFTDELSTSIINDDTRYGIWSSLVDSIIPMVVVPLVSIAVALGLMLLLRWLAGLFSVLLARVLNKVTVAEIKREIYGNDTDGEVAIGAAPRPMWMEAGGPALPADLAGLITARANMASAESLAKFRNAISEIVLSEGSPRDAGIVSSFLSWKELVHTSYFDLAEFRKLVAAAICGTTGFAPSARFAADPACAKATGWLTALKVPSTNSEQSAA